MKKLIAVIVAALFSFALIPVLPAQHYESLKIPDLEFNPPSVDRFTLDNGLVVHFYKDHTLPVVAVDVFFSAGEVYVPAERAGLAELFGTVLRTGGTTSIPPDEFNEKLDFVGARLESSCDMETGSASLRVLKKDVELCLGLMSDMLRNPLFDSEKLEIARENKLEEIRRENDDPNLVTRREFYRKLFPDHPYGRSATQETVTGVSREEILDFHAAFYHPGNCIVALSGDLTRPEAEEMIKKHFGEWQASTADPPGFPAIRDPEYGVYYIHKDLNQTSFRIGHPGIGRLNPDRHAVEVMNFILGGGGFMSRLTNKVRVQAGLSYNVGSSFYQMENSGSFYAYCQTKAETTSRAIHMMIEEIRDYIENGATEEELVTARNSILNSDVFNYSTPHRIAVQQARLELEGFPPGELVERVEAIKSVTLSDVKKAAGKYLHPDNLVFVVVGNDEMFDEPLSAFGEVTRVDIE